MVLTRLKKRKIFFQPNTYYLINVMSKLQVVRSKIDNEYFCTHVFSYKLIYCLVFLLLNPRVNNFKITAPILLKLLAIFLYHIFEITLKRIFLICYYFLFYNHKLASFRNNRVSRFKVFPK